MIITLEGPDGAGKTTLYNKLKERFGDICNFVSTYPRLSPEQWKWYNHKLVDYMTHVLDRSFISEIVYRPVKEDFVPNITLSDFAKLCTDELLVIYCQSDKAYENMKKRGDDYITTFPQHTLVSIRYFNVMQTIEYFTNAKVYRYNYEQSDLENLYAEINDFIRR